MATSDESQDKTARYNLNCSDCNKETEFKVILVSRKFGVKLECVTCGKTVHKNMKYLEGKKIGN